MPFLQCLWFEVFVEKRHLRHLKNTLNDCHGNQCVSCDQAFDKLSEKLNSRLLVQEGHGFQKGVQCAPWPQELKKKPGLDRAKLSSDSRPESLDTSTGRFLLHLHN